MNNYLSKDIMVPISGIVGILGVVALHYGVKMKIQNTNVSIDVESMQRVVQETKNNLPE